MRGRPCGRGHDRRPRHATVAGDTSSTRSTPSRSATRSPSGSTAETSGPSPSSTATRTRRARGTVDGEELASCPRSRRARDDRPSSVPWLWSGIAAALQLVLLAGPARGEGGLRGRRAILDWRAPWPRARSCSTSTGRSPTTSPSCSRSSPTSSPSRESRSPRASTTSSWPGFPTRDRARWLGADHPAVESVLAERVARYRAQVGDGSTIGPDARAAFLHAAESVPVAVVSGAHRDEVVPALAAAGLADRGSGRGHDRGRRRGKAGSGRLPARARPARRRPRPGEVTVFEDTEAGVAPRRRRECAAWRSRERMRRSGSPWRTSSLRR